jgi:hypothetical protein
MVLNGNKIGIPWKKNSIKLILAQPSLHQMPPGQAHGTKQHAGDGTRRSVGTPRTDTEGPRCNRQCADSGKKMASLSTRASGASVKVARKARKLGTQRRPTGRCAGSQDSYVFFMKFTLR